MDKSNACAAFLAHRRLAVVGVSRDPRDFSRTVVAELSRRGYDVVPVNPRGGFIRRVQDIVPPVEAALLMTPPAVTTEVVKDCAQAGIRHVWMHQGIGRGAASPAAIAFCENHGISVVSGACPLMYLPETGVVHRAHRWCREVLRSTRGRGRDRLRLPALTGLGAASAPAGHGPENSAPRAMKAGQVTDV